MAEVLPTLTSRDAVILIGCGAEPADDDEGGMPDVADRTAPLGLGSVYTPYAELSGGPESMLSAWPVGLGYSPGLPPLAIPGTIKASLRMAGGIGKQKPNFKHDRNRVKLVLGSLCPSVGQRCARSVHAIITSWLYGFASGHVWVGTAFIGVHGN